MGLPVRARVRRPMKSPNLRLAAIVLCAVTVALVWGRISMTGAGPTDRPAAPATVRSSVEAGGGAGGPAIDGTPGVSPVDSSAAASARNDSSQGTQAAGTTGAAAAGSATLTATSTRPAGFTIRIPVFMYHRIAPD